eukprot:CAMPEP_0119413986 /NCGR_PEP_ID=MMETSP1335-20130426/6325_1 /TAXON_ID=259385 /ORGANISM="Chrysoculter rhomboideus, Strain RCC1486" /LENGTH=493 /DNA_ID=CAMNT_0007438827 /DNA_START=134 /DNA_END=1615 /DNA_ORIENTATION=+
MAAAAAQRLLVRSRPLSVALRTAATANAQSSAAHRIILALVRETAGPTQVVAPVPRTTRHVIDGTTDGTSDGDTYNIVDPRTGEAVCAVADASEDDVDRAVRAARRAYYRDAWPRMPASQRSVVLHRYADLIDAHADELAGLEALSTGVPLARARSVSLPRASAEVRRFAEWAACQSMNGTPTGSALTGYTLRKPVGVIAALAPSSHALPCSTSAIAAILAAGNTVVFQAGKSTPLATLRAADLAIEAGAPPGVLNVLTGLGDTAARALAEHPFVDLLVEIATQADDAGVASPTFGKPATTVCDGADLDAAVDDVYNAAFHAPRTAWTRNEAGARALATDLNAGDVWAGAVSLARRAETGVDTISFERRQSPRGTPSEEDCGASRHLHTTMDRRPVLARGMRGRHAVADARALSADSLERSPLKSSFPDGSRGGLWTPPRASGRVALATVQIRAESKFQAGGKPVALDEEGALTLFTQLLALGADGRPRLRST